MVLFAVTIAALPNSEYCFYTAKCGDRSVVHMLTWCSAQPKMLQELKWHLKYAVSAEHFVHCACVVVHSS